MKKDIAIKWAAALRSGKYEQGKDVLRSKDNKYCCLGVLCDLMLGTEAWEQTKRDKFFTVEGSFDVLPTKVAGDVEMSTVEGMFKRMGPVNGTYYNSLTEMNDEGLSFNEIADVIENNYEDL